jgi:hypothetical protein
MAPKWSINNILMATVAIPLVVCWLVFASYVIYKGLNDPTGFVQSNLDFYVALIAIIGGPALLFINSILEAWKSEQAADLAMRPAKLELKIEQAKHQLAHDLLLTEKEQTHRQWMEAQHDHSQITGQGE